MTTPELLPHQQRVVAEKAELDDRLAKLLAFFQTEAFAGLDIAERFRLRTQARFMDGYAATLGERIAAFTPAASDAKRYTRAHIQRHDVRQDPVTGKTEVSAKMSDGKVFGITLDYWETIDLKDEREFFNLALPRLLSVANGETAG